MNSLHAYLFCSFSASEVSVTYVLAEVFITSLVKVRMFTCIIRIFTLQDQWNQHFWKTLLALMHAISCTQTYKHSRETTEGSKQLWQSTSAVSVVFCVISIALFQSLVLAAAACARRNPWVEQKIVLAFPGIHWARAGKVSAQDGAGWGVAGSRCSASEEMAEQSKKWMGMKQREDVCLESQRRWCRSCHNQENPDQKERSDSAISVLQVTSGLTVIATEPQLIIFHHPEPTCSLYVNWAKRLFPVFLAWFFQFTTPPDGWHLSM